MQEPNKDISLKEFILRINFYFRELLRKWYIVLACSIIFGALFGLRAYYADKKYIAELTFMVNEDTGPSMNAIAANILGRFDGGAGKYNLEKILSLSRSKSIIEQTLVKKKTVDGKYDYLANHFITNYELNTSVKDTLLKDFYFSDDSINTLAESTMMLNIYLALTGEKGLFSSSSNDKSGIMTLRLISNNEDLSQSFINTMFEVLSNFYIEKSIEKEKLTYDLLKQRVELLYNRMNNQLDKATSYTDKSMGIWEESSRLPSIKLTRDSRISTELYGEILKNLEIADFTMKSKTPFIQQIDYPRKPLITEEAGLYIQIVIGGIIGFLFSAIIIILRKIVLTAFQQ